MRRRIQTCNAFGPAAILLVLLLAALLAAACGGQAATTGEGTATAPAAPGRGERVVPTMPPAQFAQPTTMIDLTRVAGAQTTPVPQEVDVEFGGQIYSRLCADCHGAAGEGAAGKGEAVAGAELDEAGLVNLLRTGGEYGREHQFGIEKVSPSGIKALHAWMQTLPAPE